MTVPCWPKSLQAGELVLGPIFDFSYSYSCRNKCPMILISFPLQLQVFSSTRQFGKLLKSCPFDMITIAFASISRVESETRRFGTPFSGTFFPGPFRRPIFRDLFPGPFRRPVFLDLLSRTFSETRFPEPFFPGPFSTKSYSYRKNWSPNLFTI